MIRQAFGSALNNSSVTPDIDERFLSALGLRGLLKSLCLSRKYADSRLGFLVGKRDSVSISKRATVDVGSGFALGVKFAPEVHPIRGGSRLEIGPEATFHGPNRGTAVMGSGMIVSIQGDFRIGDSYISGDTRIHCSDKIIIGDDCAISWGVEILDGTGGHELKINGEKRPMTGEINIKDNVWIGHDATIHQGVSIGEGAIVASNSLVNDDVPPNTLVAGSPAEKVVDGVEWT